ncbi:MAG TPA: GH116 family glycosyl-hydrolase [Solirubrobacterales bacterium]|nr:GH116 family glycosyl-hydrolase [Solirubrobacterales bacterium]
MHPPRKPADEAPATTRGADHAPGEQRKLGADANAAAFPLGGIGTGTVSLGARGQLLDWEIFNNQGKGNFLPFSFFAIRTEDADGSLTRVLESKVLPPYTQLGEVNFGDPAGLPHLEGSTMRGEYPFAWIDFSDDQLPVEVGLEAFTPFVPLDADDSGIPAAVLRYRVKNRSDRPVDVTIAGSLANAVGFQESERYFPPRCDGTGTNSFLAEERVRGVLMGSKDLPADHFTNGTMALATRAENVTAKPTWDEAADSWDALMEFWADLEEDGRLTDVPPLASGGNSPYVAIPMLPIGSLAIHEQLQPGDEHTFEFLLCWHFPNRERRWNGFIFPDDDAPSDGVARNYYATRFADAWEVARYLGDELDRLDGHTRDFHRAFFGSSLPPHVLDAVSANISTIRSTTCFRIEDGTLLAWEGGLHLRGSCEGSCTHVWNYAQTMAHLFPELERSMRRVEFLLETNEEGLMAFRTNRVFGRTGWDHPATDGQLGTIVRFYREWRLSGDEEFLRELWPGARRALDYALREWDTDGDGLLDGEQHNTYDIEFFGPNSLTALQLLAALQAGTRIAAHLGEAELAANYEETARRTAAATEELLWNGEYYIQKLDDVDAHRYQYGTGCLSDQLLGEFFARAAGLDPVIPAERLRTTAAAIYGHNFKEGFYGHRNYERVYAINDEAGLLQCSWPHGGRPKQPFLFADEVWSGTEYYVASVLIEAGLVDEGLTMVAAVRDRYDGYKRNPWNEIEAGDHYARSLASWSVYTALCGSRVDLVERHISFAPAINVADFSAFFVAGGAWGIYRQSIDSGSGERTCEVEVLYGDLDGVEVNPE